jgi:iron complex transport system permease protein
MRARFGWTLAGLLAALVLTVGLAVVLGADPISPISIMRFHELPAIDQRIILNLRLPRALFAAMVGSALAASGTAFQSVFRNPLADPFVIGASSGAALGATVAIVLGLPGLVFGLSLLPVAAFAGTLLAVAAVYGIGGIGRRSSPLTLLLAGAAMSTMLGALVSLLMLMHEESLHVVYVWLLGSLVGRSWSELGAVAAFALPAIATIMLFARHLDALAFGDDLAQGVGLSVRKARAILVVAASLATAAAVAMSGLIGFVGLIAPHAVRLTIGSKHGRLIPGAVLAGATLLVAADIVAQTAAAPIEIPIGVMTAVLGGPFFLLLLRTRWVRESDGR